MFEFSKEQPAHPHLTALPLTSTLTVELRSDWLLTTNPFTKLLLPCDAGAGKQNEMKKPFFEL